MRLASAALHAGLIVMCLALAAILAVAVLGLPVSGDGLSEAVTAHLRRSGVTHPVTAVLLNFRAYDTLLEMAVLLLILVGIGSLGVVTPEAPRGAPAHAVLREVVRVLIPFFVLVAGYLLWVGAFAPGGAFHAGAVLGAAGVVLILAGYRPPVFLRALLQACVLAGLVVFIAVGIATLLMQGAFLYYPAGWSKYMILLIEAAASVSIGVTLAAMFLGSLPAAWRSGA